MNAPNGRTLPPFPTDDFTLDQLAHALDTCIEVTDDGEWKPVGGEFTLSKFLEFMSGYDPERCTDTGREIDGIPVFEAWDQSYTERCVIRALVAEVRRLRSGESLIVRVLAAATVLEELQDDPVTKQGSYTAGSLRMIARMMTGERER